MKEFTESRPRPPVPTSVSEPARRFLATALDAFGNMAPPEDIRDAAGWRQFFDKADASMIARLGAAQPGSPTLERGEFELDGVRTYVLRPDGVPDSRETPVYLDFHGGGMVMGAGEAGLVQLMPAARARDMITWAVDYRMPPSHPYPAALDDGIAVYRKALGERDPRDIFVGGASAGANLAAALLLRAKDEGLPMPAALVLLSPAVDLTESGDTFNTLLGVDYMVPVMTYNLLYAGDHDLADPYLSPLFGDVRGFPPTFLQSGTRDLLLSNTVRMHRKLRAAEVEAELHVWEAMPHGSFGGGTAEDAEVVAETLRFLARHRMPRPVASAGEPA